MVTMPGAWALTSVPRDVVVANFLSESWRLHLLHLFADLRLDILMACDVSLGCSALNGHIHALSFPISVPTEWVPRCCCRSGSAEPHKWAAKGSREEHGSAKAWAARETEKEQVKGEGVHV